MIAMVNSFATFEGLVSAGTLSQSQCEVPLLGKEASILDLSMNVSRQQDISSSS